MSQANLLAMLQVELRSSPHLTYRQILRSRRFSGMTSIDLQVAQIRLLTGPFLCRWFPTPCVTSYWSSLV